MLDFRLFAVKSMKFSLTRFSKIQVYIHFFITIEFLMFSELLYFYVLDGLD